MKLELQFKEISSLIQKAKENSFKAVNTELISLYLSIGEYISNKISTSVWGKSIVTNLSDYLILNQPNSKGFSSQNLWRMKQFYETYAKNSKLSPLVREITWSNNLAIISKTKTDKNQSVVEYTLPENNEQIFASKYKTVLPSKEELKSLIAERNS